MADQINTTVIDIVEGKNNRRAEQSVANISKRLVEQRRVVDDLVREQRDLTRVMREGMDVTQRLARNEVALTSAKKKRKDIEDDLRHAIAGTNRETEQQNRLQAQNARLFGDVESRTRAITGAVGFVGGAGGQRIERTVNVGAEVFASVEAIGLLKQELPELVGSLNLTRQSVALFAVGMAAAGAAALIAKDALDDWQDSAKAARETVTGTINALKDYYDFIGDATSEDIRTRLDEVAQRRDLNQQLKTDLLELQNAILQGLNPDDPSFRQQAAAGAVRALDALGVLGFGTDEVNKALAEVNTNLNQNAVEFNLLVDAYTTGAAAANDAAKQEQEYTQAKLDGLERERKIILESNNLTRDQLNDRLDSIDRERESYRTLLSEIEQLDQNEQTAGRIKELSGEIARLDEETRILTESVSPLVDAREQEKSNIDALAMAHQRSAEIFKRAQEELVSGAQGLIASSRDTASLVGDITDVNNSIDQERIKFEEAQAKEQIKHYQDLAKIDQKYFEDRADTLQDINADIAGIDNQRIEEIQEFNKESIRLAEDHQGALLKIERDLDNGIQSAIENRSTAAAIAAARSAQEQASDENARFETEKQRREEDFNGLLKQINAERNERMRAGQQELIDLRNRHNAERAERINAFQAQASIARAEYNMKIQQQQAEISALQAHQSRMFQLTQAFHAATEQSLASRLQGFSRSLAPTGFNDALAAPKTLTTSNQNNVTLSMQNSFGGGSSDIEMVFQQRIVPNLIKALNRVVG